MPSAFRERRLPPTEVRRILRRAAEIAETDPETDAAERALTQDELERHGAELGLPASAIRRAVSAPLGPDPSGERPWLEPRDVLLEQEIAGEVSADRHEEIVEAIRAAVGVEGRTEVVGKTLSFYLPRAVAPLITIRSKDGATRVRVTERLNGAAALAGLSTFAALASLMGVGVGMDVMRSALAAGVIGAVVMLCGVFASSLVAARGIRRREAWLEHVMERAGAAVSAAAEPAVEPAAPARVRVAEIGGAGEPAGATAEEREREAEAEVEAEAGSVAAVERS